MLITDSYKQLNAELHDREPFYGTSGKKHTGAVYHAARQFNTRDVLDYGCGKQRLKEALSDVLNVRGYDPAVPGLDAPPEPADLVVCTDVLEHIEPTCLDEVLIDLRRLTKRALFAVISTRPAIKTLADGRNAHLIVEPASWWLRHLLDHFEPVQFQRRETEFEVVMVPK